MKTDVARLPLNTQQKRVNTSCPNCKAHTWWKTHPPITQKRRVNGHVRYRLRCEKCGHEWWWGRNPAPPMDRGHRIILRRCDIPWKARGILWGPKRQYLVRVFGRIMGASATRIDETERQFAEEGEKRTRALQARYGVSDEQIALLRRALAIYDDLIGDVAAPAAMREGLVQYYSRLAVERARGALRRAGVAKDG